MPALMPAYYAAEVNAFLNESTTSIVGQLADGIPREGFLELRSSQIAVWTPEIQGLKAALTAIQEKHPEVGQWGVLLEFPIPRRARRIDALLLTPRAVFVIEFKAQQKDLEALRQVEGYAFDLRDFHRPSRDLQLIPILVSATKRSVEAFSTAEDVYPACSTTPEELGALLWKRYSQSRATNAVSLATFNSGEYHPVPSIIDAAIAVFDTMGVREIADASCGAHNLSSTVQALREIVGAAVKNRRKAICFVTGVPGSGKTLAGLTIAHDSEIRQLSGAEAAFFSGILMVF